MKQNKFRLIHLMAFSFLNFIFVSCTNWNDFFESYNKNFAPIAPEQKKFVLSDETQTSLIREEFFDIDYSIDSELTASFCAPVDCDKYLFLSLENHRFGSNRAAFRCKKHILLGNKSNFSLLSDGFWKYFLQKIFRKQRAASSFHFNSNS